MKFGTSGLRGLVVDMTDETIASYVRAFLGHMSGQGGVLQTALVGRDLRPSSPRIAAVCLAAVRAAGVDAVDCGELPTPALALEALARRAPAIMVTGSHIPFDRNGLKFYTPAGEITKADEAGILSTRNVAREAPLRSGSEAAEANALARYKERNLGILPQGALSGLKVGVYQHSAVGRDLIVDLLQMLGAETMALGRTNAFVPVDTEAVHPEDAERARAWAVGHGLDAIVSTDGDGDRPLVFDEHGDMVRGDVLGLLTARAIGADAVATPVSSSTALERSGWVAKVARTKIGSPFVIEALERLSAEGATLPAGYEANGGFILGGSWTREGRPSISALPTRDAMLPILALLGEMGRRTLPLSVLVAETPRRFTASDRLTNIAPERIRTLLDGLRRSDADRDRLAKRLDVASVLGIDTLDGVRMSLPDDEIVHLRASGNAPELRAYAEAAGPERASGLVGMLLSSAADHLAAIQSAEAPNDG